LLNTVVIAGWQTERDNVIWLGETRSTISINPTRTAISDWEVDLLTVFGSIAVAMMMLSYWLEPRSKWFILLFAVGCAATAAYSGLVRAYPITVIEALWALIAVRRFSLRHRHEAAQGAS
jgi:hypothetical protein